MSELAQLERNAVGSILLDPSRIDDVRGMLSPFDFADLNLGELFETICTAHEAGIDVADPAVVLQEARKRNLPADIANAGFLARLYTEHQSTNTTYYAGEVKRASRRRALEQIGRELIRRVGEPDADPEAVAAWLESQTSAATAMSRMRERRFCEAASDYYAEISKSDFSGKLIMTGLERVDECVGGWHPGELVILAARPGMGKTAFALNWAKRLTERSRSVLIVSLEMQDIELAGRILCGQSEVNNRKIRSGRHSSQDLEAIKQAARDAAQLREDLFFWSPPTATVGQIRARAKRVKAIHGLDFLVVDYIGFIESTNKRLKKWEHISQVSRELKVIAKELEVPVLALCQLNRDADGTEPKLSQLRDSGSIEQDADGVIFLHRDPTASEEWDYSRLQSTPEERAKLYKNESRFIVGKHRHGENLWVKLRWLPSRTMFADIPANVMQSADEWTG